MGYRFQKDFNMVPSYALKRDRKLRWHISVRVLGSIPGLGRSPGEGNSYSLQSSDLENSKDCIVMGSQGVGHNWATLTFAFTSVLLGGAGGKESACQCRLGFDPWVGKSPWRRKWHPTPVPLLGKSHGQRSLVGYSPWGHKESDTTEWLSTVFLHHHTVHMCALPVSCLLIESNNFMVRSIFSIFIIKKYHCTPLVHMICYSYFYFQIFLLSLGLLHLKIGFVVSEFIISLMPVSSLEVSVLFPYSHTHPLPLLGALSPRLFWPAPSAQVTLRARCSVCILGSPIATLEAPFSSFCTWLPCFLGMLSPLFPCSFLLLSL